MGRLVNGSRTPKEIAAKAGKLLVFCEGDTEYNYLDYFKSYLEHNVKSKYTDLVLEPVNTKGNARHVFLYAEDFLEQNDNAGKYADYEKHLVFDCDAPEEIQDVIFEMQESKHNYVLGFSCLLVETWLVMHFSEVEIGVDVKKSKIYKRMRDFLNVSRYTTRTKASKGMIGKLLAEDGDKRIRAAIQNAKRLETQWKEQGKDYRKNIKEMNPVVNIHHLVEMLLDEIEYACS